MLDLNEVSFLHHVESRWLLLLPAVERVKKQFPALLECFLKLPDSVNDITKNDGYKRNYGFTHILRDYGSAIFPRICEGNV